MPNPGKPTNLKVLEGTYKPKTANLNEPDPDVEIPECPVELSTDAKIEWERITPLLEVLGLIAQINRATLAQYCQLYGRWIVAERMIAEQGEVITIVKDIRRGKMGSPKDDKPGEVVPEKYYTSSKKNPWVDIALKCAQECRRFANEFGMTPSSQTKVTARPKGNKKDKQSRFFK
jgi:P27 family predicted phage terminase small subunit